MLAPKSVKSCEIPRQFEVIGGQGHRSISQTGLTLDVSPTVFEILTFKARKWLVFLTPPLFDAAARGNTLEFLDETISRKN